MIQHFVFFKFKEGTTQEAVQQHLVMFAALKDHIPQISGYAGGEVLASPNGQRTYDTAHYVTFANHEDLEVYQPHPAHQAFIEANRVNWQSVLSIDSQAA
jgi:hypothetical protein